MVACNGSKTNEAYPLPMKYLPVQLEGSKMWSILDLESGDVVVKDVYKAMPSAVVNDMYFVMNDEGTFDYYNVADPKNQSTRSTLAAPPSLAWRVWLWQASRASPSASSTKSARW